MPIAVIVAAAVAAAAPPAARATLAVPPIVVDLVTLSAVPSSVVAVATSEADAVFRGAGIRFIWRRGGRALGALRVIIDDDAGPPHQRDTPLGWLVFENDVPAREIHLSYANAEQFMEGAREVVGAIHQKTRAERDLYLGRALGRALAHELGHYLLATKTHTPKGLLKGSRTAQEFFLSDRSAFSIDVVERRLIAARIRKEFDLARLND